MKKLILYSIILILLPAAVKAQSQDAKARFYAGITAEEIEGDLDKAINIYQDILKDKDVDRQLAAKCIYHIGICHDKKESGKAMDFYVDLLEKYPDQGDLADLARNRITKLKDANTFIDPRDGHKYKFVKIGDQTWMAENLAYMPHVNPPGKDEYGIWVFDYDGNNLAEAKATENYQKYGCLYNWHTAMGIGPEYLEKTWEGDRENWQGICPPGWRMPSDDDWKELELFLGMPDTLVHMGDGETRAGDDMFNSGHGLKYPPIGDYLKQPHSWLKEGSGNNYSGLSLLPGGYRYENEGFTKLGYACWLWTSSDTIWSLRTTGSTHSAFSREVYAQSADVQRNYYFNKRDGMSVRCIKGNNDTPASYSNPFEGKTSFPESYTEIVEKTRAPEIEKKYGFDFGKDGSRSRPYFVMNENILVFINNGSENLVALNRHTFQEIWTFQAPEKLSGGVAISGRAVFCTSRKGFYSVSLDDGRLLWERDGLANIGTVKGTNDILLVTLADTLRAVSQSSGKDIWKIPAQDKWFGYPLFDENIVYLPIWTKAASIDKNKKQSLLWAIDLHKGQLIWEFKDYGWIWDCVLNDRTLIITPWGHIKGSYCWGIDSNTGRKVWKTYLGDNINIGRKVKADDFTIGIGSSLGKDFIYAIDPEGNIKWKTKINNPLWIMPESPKVYKGELFFLTRKYNESIKLISYNLQTGQTKTNIDLGLTPNTYPEFLNNKMYIGASDGLYVFDFSKK